MDYDLIDKSKEEKEEAKAKRTRERYFGDIRKVLAQPEGRRLYWTILSRAGVFHSSWTGDTNQTLVNEGRRAIGLMFMDDLLAASPSAFNQMQREMKAINKEEE